MITNRRAALAAVWMTAFSGAGRLIARTLRLSPHVAANPSFVTSTQQNMNTPEERLRMDLERLSGRVYSEEGIPMFLACENLASSQNPVLLTDLNKNLAAALSRDTGAWQRVHPDAPASDVAKIVEVLADRDFANGGLGKSL